MKNGIITLFLALLCVSSFAQSLNDEMSAAKSSLTESASNLDALLSKINTIRSEAQTKFDRKAQILAATRQALATRRVDLEKDNSREKDMMADKWPSRVASREQLVRDEAKLAYDEQVLALNKSDFETRYKQVEQHIKSTFVMVIKAQNSDHSSVMKSYLGSLGSFSL